MNEESPPDSVIKPLDEVLGSVKVEMYKPAEQEAPNAEEPQQLVEGDSPVEIGGPKGPEPTRYGDWEKKGRCIDF
ncbi:MAG: DUF1674 domain-containing protein [Salinisphaeraceae bacterium]|nr:DUF1674 domain-containing protein [Salinisphaeraceae bacterium]